MSDKVYLDYNATAPVRPEVKAAVNAAMDVLGNPSSVHAGGRPPARWWKPAAPRWRTLSA
jgi:cysteine sulfinate desulfinase/cysteine desulfurase-like protein